MTTVQIIPAGIHDVASLQKISVETFTDTFASYNTAADMQQYVSTNLSEKKLAEELKDANASFYFAVDGSNVIGYLKLNQGASQTELKDASCIEIERIYVLSAYHGKQVAQLLYAKAIDVARQLKVDFIWLGVWEENKRAIRFYEKNGFIPFDTHIFMLGDDAQTDILMKKVL